MAEGFTKLFSSITASTVWAESHATRIVWITMLAMADSKGRVMASVPGLAHFARVTLEECERALQRFIEPDGYSRTPDHDGRRIEAIQGGWRLLNHSKYREMRDEECRREYMRTYMHDRRKQNELTKLTVNNVSRSKPPLAKAEAEADTEKTKSTTTAFAQASPSRSQKVNGHKISFDFAKGAFQGISEEQELAWQDAYPAVPIPPAIARAAAWLQANPANKKSNYARFLVNWFGREQDKAGRVR